MNYKEVLADRDVWKIAATECSDALEKAKATIAAQAEELEKLRALLNVCRNEHQPDLPPNVRGVLAALDQPAKSEPEQKTRKCPLCNRLGVVLCDLTSVSRAEELASRCKRCCGAGNLVWNDGSWRECERCHGNGFEPRDSGRPSTRDGLANSVNVVQLGAEPPVDGSGAVLGNAHMSPEGGSSLGHTSTTPGESGAAVASRATSREEEMLRGGIANLHAHLDEREARIRGHENARAELNAEIASLRQKLEAAHGYRGNLMADLDRLESQLAEVSSERDLLLRAAFSAAETLKSQSEKIDERDEQVASINRQLDELRTFYITSREEALSEAVRVIHAMCKDGTRTPTSNGHLGAAARAIEHVRDADPDCCCKHCKAAKGK